MWLTESFQHRLQQPEMMDQPTLDESRHVQALRGLERINYLSGCAGTFWPALHEAAQSSSGRPLRVLDVATGGGDVPLRLWHRAERAGLNVEIEGCDRSPVAMAHASRQARAQQAQVRFFEADILGGPFSERYDVVMCSLFLHHLAEHEAVQVLRTMAQATRRLVLVSDLRRSRPGCTHVAWLVDGLAWRSGAVHEGRGHVVRSSGWSEDPASRGRGTWSWRAGTGGFLGHTLGVRQHVLGNHPVHSPRTHAERRPASLRRPGIWSRPHVRGGPFALRNGPLGHGVLDHMVWWVRLAATRRGAWCCPGKKQSQDATAASSSRG